jgi:hypothetical protein
MASIALSVNGCIDYLAYGAIFTRAVFLFVAKEATTFFYSRQKSRRCPPGGCEGGDSHAIQWGVQLFPTF